MGKRPDIKLSVKLKDGGERLYPGAGWKSDNGKGINFKLDDGWKLVAPDGTEHTSGKEGNSWFDVYDNRDDNGGGGRPKTQYGGGDFGGDDFDDSGIPF